MTASHGPSLHPSIHLILTLSEANEPSFLRKLRSQQAGRDTDRHERQIARPKRAKVAVDDDAPTYVDEESNDTLSKEEYEALVAAEVGPDNNEEDAEAVATAEVAAVVHEVDQKQSIIEVGKNHKKRRAAKMVGADDEGGSRTATRTANKSKKPPKAVKLSFGVEEAEQ